jgi:hypothetical protein
MRGEGSIRARRGEHTRYASDSSDAAFAFNGLNYNLHKDFSVTKRGEEETHAVQHYNPCK